MQQIRIFFEKKDSAKYISHLDLMRCFERCVRRAGIPIWYTEGFNPRPFMTFALPLSLGTSGLREIVDIRLTQEMDFGEVAAKLNACLPAGLAVTDVAQPQNKPTQICASRYSILAKGEQPDSVIPALEAFLGGGSIVIKKLNKKKKEVEVDLFPYIKSYSIEKCGDKVKLLAVLSSGCTENLNPSLLLDTFAGKNGQTRLEYEITREDILDSALDPFV